jgi:hypothetical protein
VVKAGLNITIFALLSSICLARAYWLSLPAQVYTGYPKEAVEWIRQNHPNGRLLSTYDWGGYLTYTLPEYPVFIDGRADLYGEEFMRYYADLLAAPPSWQTALAEYNVGVLLLPPATPLADAASRSSTWRLAYDDGLAVILVQR